MKHYPSASLLLHLRNGVLQLSNGHGNVSVSFANSTNVTDGQWHQLGIRRVTVSHLISAIISYSISPSLFRQDTKGSIQLVVDRIIQQHHPQGDDALNRLNFSLKHFATDKLARIRIGRVPNQQTDGFKVVL